MKRAFRTLGVSFVAALMATLVSAGGAWADPPGNNGTVKIDGVDFDDHPNNEPHVGCVFQIDFTGFDAGQQVSASVEGQPPTGGGLLASATTTLDGSGAGSITLDLSGAFGGITPHPQQGYHVKLTVETGRGAGKHKVFWVECGPLGSAELPPTGAGEMMGEVAPITIDDGPTSAFEPGGISASRLMLLAGLGWLSSVALRKAVVARLHRRS